MTVRYFPCEFKDADKLEVEEFKGSEWQACSPVNSLLIGVVVNGVDDTYVRLSKASVEELVEHLQNVLEKWGD